MLLLLDIFMATVSFLAVKGMLKCSPFLHFEKMLLHLLLFSVSRKLNFLLPGVVLTLNCDNSHFFFALVQTVTSICSAVVTDIRLTLCVVTLVTVSAPPGSPQSTDIWLWPPVPAPGEPRQPGIGEWWPGTRHQPLGSGGPGYKTGLCVESGGR